MKTTSFHPLIWKTKKWFDTKAVFSALFIVVLILVLTLIFPDSQASVIRLFNIPIGILWIYFTLVFVIYFIDTDNGLQIDRKWLRNALPSLLLASVFFLFRIDRAYYLCLFIMFIFIFIKNDIRRLLLLWVRSLSQIWRYIISKQLNMSIEFGLLFYFALVWYLFLSIRVSEHKI